MLGLMGLQGQRGRTAAAYIYTAAPVSSRDPVHVCCPKPGPNATRMRALWEWGPCSCVLPPRAAKTQHDWAALAACGG